MNKLLSISDLVLLVTFLPQMACLVI